MLNVSGKDYGWNFRTILSCRHLHHRLSFLDCIMKQMTIIIFRVIFYWFLKLVSAIFIKFLFFHQMIALQKLRKMLFSSSKKLFSFSRYSIFVFLSFPLFLPVGHCFRGWLKINLKVYDVIHCLNKNSVTHFVWYLKKEKRNDIETLSIDIVSDKGQLYRKIMPKMCSKSLSQISL